MVSIRQPLFVTIVLLSICNSVRADSEVDRIRREPLRGISKLRVTVSVNSAVLRRDAIRADVEVQLRRSGLRVLPPDITAETLELPSLVVEVITDEIPLRGVNGIHVYSVKIDVLDPVVIKRNRLGILAPVWQSGHFGFVGAAKINAIRECVFDETTKLVNDIMAANSK